MKAHVQSLPRFMKPETVRAEPVEGLRANGGRQWHCFTLKRLKNRGLVFMPTDTLH